MKAEQKTDGKPELGDGHTQIADELLDAIIRTRIPGEAMQVFLFILRKTYGYHKKEVPIKQDEFVRATGMRRQSVDRALEKLKRWQLITKKKDSKKSPVICKYGINKYYLQWLVDSKKGHDSKKSHFGLQKESLARLQKESTVLKEKVLKENLKRSTLSLGNETALKKLAADLERKAKLAPLLFVYDHWNAQVIIRHKKLTEKIKQKIRTHLKENALEDITQAIDNYNTALKSPDYFFKFKWTLIDFLDRGLRKFVNEAQPLDNFKAKDTGQKSPLSKPFIVKCAKCKHTWLYENLKSFICPKCEHFNGQYYRKNGQTGQDIQSKVDNKVQYSDHLIKEAKVAVSGLLRDVPALTKSQKEALDGQETERA